MRLIGVNGIASEYSFLPILGMKITRSTGLSLIKNQICGTNKSTLCWDIAGKVSSTPGVLCLLKVEIEIKFFATTQSKRVSLSATTGGVWSFGIASGKCVSKRALARYSVLGVKLPHSSLCHDRGSLSLTSGQSFMQPCRFWVREDLLPKLRNANTHDVAYKTFNILLIAATLKKN